MTEPTRTTNAILERADRERMPEGFLAFPAELRGRFEERRAANLAGRERSLTAAHAGRPPGYRPDSEATRGDWRIELPESLRTNTGTAGSERATRRHPVFGGTNRRRSLEKITKECGRQGAAVGRGEKASPPGREAEIRSPGRALLMFRGTNRRRSLEKITTECGR